MQCGCRGVVESGRLSFLESRGVQASVPVLTLTGLPAAAIERQFVEVAGAKVSFLRAGSGPPLVLVHGLVGQATNWEANLPALAGERTVYALDLINMGQSSRMRVDESLRGHAERLRGFLNAVGIERADLVGASHGGTVCLMFAAMQPERVRTLMLFAPANPFCRNGNLLLWFYGTAPGRLFARLIPLMPRIVHQIALRRVYGNKSCVSRRTVEGYTYGMDQAGVVHVMGIVKRWWPDMEDLRGLLPRVWAVKTLLVWGDRDPIVGLDSGVRLRKELGAEMALVVGAGHLVYTERAGWANAVMLGWLRVEGCAAELPGEV